MKMEKTRILSGEVLVSKGALKINSTLPEAGVKDVLPNGSWLEQKQIQAALEARKQLIELERIEKSGVLSHAEWCEDLMLAKVTQKVGSYWQYLGHNVGKDLFLNPEETLFLMEVNCLVLFRDEVKVSLQQAYAMLLPNGETLMQYKVYASLSRQGYRVYRYKSQLGLETECEKRLKLLIQSTENENEIISINNIQNKSIHRSAVHKVDNATNMRDVPSTINTASNVLAKKESTTKTFKYIERGIQRLKSRRRKALKFNIFHDTFQNIPDFFKQPVVNIMVPEKRYLPGKINVKNCSYLVNVEKMRTKTSSSEEMPTTSSTSNDPLNTVYGSYVRRLRQTPPMVPRCNVWGDSYNFRFASQPNIPLRHFGFWRPPPNFSFFHLNMTFQRPFQYIPQFGPRVILNPLLQPFLPTNNNESMNMNTTHNRKRCRKETKKEHFDTIKKLATFVKKTILELRVSDENVARLKHLIQTYNTSYKTRLRLSDDFNVIFDENVVDTIEVDDDDEPAAKKLAVDVNTSFNDKLQRLERLASQLKSLRSEVTSRHRRMVTKLMKTFNDSYITDYYLNNNFDLIDRNDLTELSSSSDTEIIEENPVIPNANKKLKNPFSILKQLSDKQKEESQPSTSKDHETISFACKRSFKYSNSLVKTFKGWLPDIKDFGRPEIISNKLANEIIDIRKEEFLFDFLGLQPDKFKSWYDLKISFLRSLKETSKLFHCESQNGPYLNSLVKQEDFVDRATVLKKLSIIQSHRAVDENENLTIDFDVYNKDVQNFRKSYRPAPHFRVVCVKESSILPSGADAASLHSKCKDNVNIIFAVVGSGSISYLQINPIDLPIYMSNINNSY